MKKIVFLCLMSSVLVLAGCGQQSTSSQTSAPSQNSELDNLLNE